MEPVSLRRCSRRSIPDELISEVLVRLPVKSLLRFRCVSTTWRSLISHPHLVQSHHRRSQQHPLALVGERTRGDDILHRDNAERIYYDSAAHFNSINNVGVTVFSSSPDLICIAEGDGDRCSLLNPATRERVNLPEHAPLQVGLVDYLGFGYVPSLKRFKVARLFDQMDTDPGSGRLVVKLGCEVVTVGVDRSWRPATDPPFLIASHQMAFFRGALHMTPSGVAAPGGEEGKGLAALDLETEAWRVIPMPRGVSGKNAVRLREQRGLLFLDHLLGGGRVNVWVMNDYDKGGWAMEHRINLARLQMPEILRGFLREGIRPVMIGRDGRILIYVCWKALLWYDPRDQKVTPLPRYENSAVCVFPPRVHVENYLPLNGWD